MSYLIRCDKCGKEIARVDAHDTQHTGAYRIDMHYEPNNFHMYAKHLCSDCLVDFERFLNVNQDKG